MADAMEMMILSILAPQLHCEWRLPSWQVALLTSVGKNNWQLLYSVRFFHSLLFRCYALYPKVKSVHGLCRLPLARKDIGVFFESQSLKKWNSVRTEEISQFSGSNFHVISRKIYELTQTHPEIQTIWLTEKKDWSIFTIFLGNPSLSPHLSLLVHRQTGNHESEQAITFQGGFPSDLCKQSSYNTTSMYSAMMLETCSAFRDKTTSFGTLLSAYATVVWHAL